jgi:hypothetical protein
MTRRYDFEKQDSVLRDKPDEVRPLKVVRHLAVDRYLCPTCRQEFVKLSGAAACVAAHIDGTAPPRGSAAAGS